MLDTLVLEAIGKVRDAQVAFRATRGQPQSVFEEAIGNLRDAQVRLQWLLAVENLILEDNNGKTNRCDAC